MSDNKDLGVDVSKARFWSNAKMTIEIPMPDKDVVERALGYVPIVRCEECKWFDGQELCDRHGFFVGLDLTFFCRDGERREPEG